jgi:serine/threonine-protein kinase
MHITNPPAAMEKPSTSSLPLLRTMSYDRGISGRTIGGAVLVVALVVGLAAAFSRTGQSSAGSAAGSSGAASAGGGAAAAPSAGAATPPAEASTVPVVAVDSLPVAARAAAAAKGNGRLSIAATPGWCSVSVDGVGKGVTPIASLELSAGTHRVDCVPPSGKPRSASVSVVDGSITRHKFSLDE